MKKVFFYASAGLLLASCASDEIVDVSKGDGYGHTTEAPISFVSNQKNITRAKNLQDVGHYNFGVFAYKETDKVNNIMDNYLVGYMDEDNSKGYMFTLGNQTTLGDKGGLADGASYWQYEGLGNAEYNYSGAGYYNVSQTEYMSNKTNQYLRYWDLASDYTNFIAYAPYINGSLTATYVDGTAQGSSSDTYTLTFPNGSITDGYDDESKYEYMYASNHVAKASYGHDVPLSFKRLNAKVNIKFWEDVKGYSVRILDLGNGYEGVQAAASIKKAVPDDPADTETYGPYGYRDGLYYQSNGVKIQFNPANGNVAAMMQFKNTTADNTRPLVFAAPTAAEIGTARVDASPSATTYYAIPKYSGEPVMVDEVNMETAGEAVNPDLAKTGFTFHVSYELTSDTGERIVVKNATVHVPCDYCEWRENTHYTYIFKITANSNGSTDPSDDPNIDPTDPEVPTEPALYPIIFDNCTVQDWEEIESEWEITDGTELVYHDIQLSTYSLVNGDIDVTITGDHNYTGATIDYTAVSVTPADPKVTYNSGTQKITVAEGAPAGVYTVTYTCNAPTGVAHNHPKTWTETFLVGNAYTVATNLSEVGTNGTAASKLLITTTMDGTENTADADQLYIKTPENVTEGKVKVEQIDGKWYVTVAQDATPGKYELVYKVTEPTETKVDSKVFEVVDYNFHFDNSIVELGASPVVVKAFVPETAGVISMTTATGISVDNAAKTISVANTAAEGTYTVTYTVNGSTVSTVSYEQTFTVYNTYAVSLDKAVIERDLNRENDADQGSDQIQIVTAKNGVNVTIDNTTLSVVKEDGTDASADFTISTTGVLKVYKTAAAGNYKVKYVGQTGDDRYVVYAPFAVKE